MPALPEQILRPRNWIECIVREKNRRSLAEESSDMFLFRSLLYHNIHRRFKHGKLAMMINFIGGPGKKLILGKTRVVIQKKLKFLRLK